MKVSFEEARVRVDAVLDIYSDVFPESRMHKRILREQVTKCLEIIGWSIEEYEIQADREDRMFLGSLRSWSVVNAATRLVVSDYENVLFSMWWADGIVSAEAAPDMVPAIERWVARGVVEWVGDDVRWTQASSPDFLLRLKSYLESQFFFSCVLS